MSLRLKRTKGTDPDFIKLVQALDAELLERDGDENDFYSQYNGLEDIHHAVVAYEADQLLGIGAFKSYDSKAVEIKRMYTLPVARGKGTASKVLQELEKWAAELSYSKTILETGKRQPEAIALYTKAGYQRIQNFAPYEGVENSVCFSKFIGNSGGEDI